LVGRRTDSELNLGCIVTLTHGKSHSAHVMQTGERRKTEHDAPAAIVRLIEIASWRPCSCAALLVCQLPVCCNLLVVYKGHHLVALILCMGYRNE